MRSNASIKGFREELLNNKETRPKRTSISKRLGRRDPVEIDKRLIKKLSSNDIIEQYEKNRNLNRNEDSDSHDNNSDIDAYDDDDNDGGDGYNDNDRMRTYATGGIRHLLRNKNLKGSSAVNSNSFMILILEKERQEVNTQEMITSAPISRGNRNKSSAVFTKKKETFVKVSREAVQFLIRLSSFNIFVKSDDDDFQKDKILDITTRFKDALNTFNKEIIKIGSALPLDLIDNGNHQHHHHHYPETRIFYFVKQKGYRAVMHVLANCIYKDTNDVNIPLLLSGLNLLLFPMEALQKKMIQIENNESLEWPKQMVKLFLNWSAMSFHELASTGAIPLLTKIIRQTDNCINPNIQLVAYTLLQQLIVSSELCLSQLLYDPPIKEKKNHLNIIDRLIRDEKIVKKKKLSEEELLLKMKKTVESEFRKDLRESLYRRPFKKEKPVKTVKDLKTDFIAPRDEHFSFIDYGDISCISTILTSAISNQNRHEIIASFASLVWVMIKAAEDDEEVIRKTAMTLSEKIRIDILKEPYKNYKDTKKKLSLIESKEAVNVLRKPSSEMMQISVLDFLISCIKRFHTQVQESITENKRSAAFDTYKKLCKTFYSFMTLSDFILSSIMASSKSMKLLFQTFAVFPSSRSMMHAIENLRQKISKKRATAEPKTATSTLKEGNDKLKALIRPSSAPSHKLQKPTCDTNGQQQCNHKSQVRPKSACTVVENFNMNLIGQSPAMPKKIQMQMPSVEYPMTILSPERKLQKLSEHKKAVEMAQLLQEALTPKKISSDFNTEEENEEEEVPINYLDKISFNIDINSDIHLESGSSSLQKFEQNIEYNWEFDKTSDVDFDKTINDVLIIRAMRNAINDNKDMIEFYNIMNTMNIDLSVEQINNLYIAIKNDVSLKNLLLLLQNE